MSKDAKKKCVSTDRCIAAQWTLRQMQLCALPVATRKTVKYFYGPLIDSWQRRRAATYFCKQFSSSSSLHFFVFIMFLFFIAIKDRPFRATDCHHNICLAARSECVCLLTSLHLQILISLNLSTMPRQRRKNM